MGRGGSAVKYLDEYRDAATAERLIDEIHERATKCWTLMDVCGGQTHGLVRSGIEQKLSGIVELIHGPGCPVCVTPTKVIDFAIALAMCPRTIVASFGDMLRVPGSDRSLMEARAAGGNVQIVYSPVDAVELAKKRPDHDVVFLGVGFETTAPATAIAIRQAADQDVKNFSVIPAHVRVLPAMQAIMSMPENRVQGFLAAGHVCIITGYKCYEPFVRQYQVPVVVTGFEPVDLLQGILRCVKSLEQGEPVLANAYGRSVSESGNVAARQMVESVYQVADREWRGFGVVPNGGFAVKDMYRDHDASLRFAAMMPQPTREDSRCRGAEVMSGKIKPKQCPEFGTTCTPESPLGAPMVSGEGACAAYYRFDPVMITPPENEPTA